ncbi:MAG TPA: hypothetical protein VGJ84_03965 [Polyangiaceae bacterium]|jgi:hypothetical protein
MRRLFGYAALSTILALPSACSSGAGLGSDRGGNSGGNGVGGSGQAGVPGQGGTGQGGQTGLTGGMTGNSGSGGANGSGGSFVILPPSDGGFDPDAGCTGISAAATNKVQPSDIILAVDQSGSMGTEAGWVQQQLNGFSQTILTAGIDVHVVLIASPDGGAGLCSGSGNKICVPPPLAGSNCGDSASFLNVNCHVESHDALERIISLYPQYKDFLRPEASKHFIAISDDNANFPMGTSTAVDAAASYDAQIRALDPILGNYVFHSIYAYIAHQGCPSDGEGTVYRELVKLRGGVEGDLCVQDFQPVWDAVSQKVVTGAGLACEWNIPEPPQGQLLDPTLVNVQFTASGVSKILGRIAYASDCSNYVDAWYYDDQLAPTKILVCPDVCAAFQSATAQQVNIVFGCAAQFAAPR